MRAGRASGGPRALAVASPPVFRVVARTRPHNELAREHRQEHPDRVVTVGPFELSHRLDGGDHRQCGVDPPQTVQFVGDDPHPPLGVGRNGEGFPEHERQPGPDERLERVLFGLPGDEKQGPGPIPEGKVPFRRKMLPGPHRPERLSTGPPGRSLSGNRGSRDPRSGTISFGEKWTD